MGTKAERHSGSQRRLEGLEGSFGSCLPERPSAEWGSSIAPLQGSVRGHTAPWDFQIPQGWHCTMTRARHLFVRCPLQVLTSKNCSALLNLWFYEDQHISSFSSFGFFETACQEAQCLLNMQLHRYGSLDSWLHYTCASLLAQYTQLLCFFPKEGDVFSNRRTIWSPVFIAHIGWTLICSKSLQVENLAKTHIIEWISCCAWINEAYTVA